MDYILQNERLAEIESKEEYAPKEAGYYLRCSESKIRRLCNNKVLTHRRDQRVLWIPGSTLINYIKDTTVAGLF